MLLSHVHSCAAGSVLHQCTSLVTRAVVATVGPTPCVRLLHSSCSSTAAAQQQLPLSRTASLGLHRSSSDTPLFARPHALRRRQRRSLAGRARKGGRSAKRARGRGIDDDFDFDSSDGISGGGGGGGGSSSRRRDSKKYAIKPDFEAVALARQLAGGGDSDGDVEVGGMSLTGPDAEANIKAMGYGMDEESVERLQREVAELEAELAALNDPDFEDGVGGGGFDQPIRSADRHELAATTQHKAIAELVCCLAAAASC